MTLSDVPFLPDSAIERRAFGLIEQHFAAMGRPIAAPISIDDIAEKHLGLTLEFDDLAARLGVKDVLGAIWFEEKLIRIEQSIDHEGRFAFTFAHEVGHWTLHRHLAERRSASDLFAAGSTRPTVVCRSLDAKQRVEVQADKFAAALLMPRSLVVTAFRAATGAEHYVLASCGKTPTPSDLAIWKQIAASVIETGRFSNVSVEAMRIRLVSLELIVSRAPADRTLF